MEEDEEMKGKEVRRGEEKMWREKGRREDEVVTGSVKSMRMDLEAVDGSGIFPLGAIIQKCNTATSL